MATVETPVSPSEAVRDRQGFPEAPTEVIGGPPGMAAPVEAPPAAPPAPQQRPTPFGSMANQMLPEVFQRLSETNTRLDQGRQAQGVGLAPYISQAADAFERAIAGRKAPPVAPVIPAPPSVGLTAFLDPVEGESPAASIGKLIQAVGLFAVGIGGLAKGDARAGLAALTGAMKGWQEGDAEAADRAFRDWDAKTKAALDNWKNERTSYLDIMEAANLDLSQRFKLTELVALKHSNDMMADVARAQDLQKMLDFLGKQATATEQVEVEWAKVGEARESHAAREARAAQEFAANQAMKALQLQLDQMRLANTEAYQKAQLAQGDRRLALQGVEIGEKRADREEQKAGRLGSEADRIRGDLEKASKEFVAIRSAFARVQTSAKNPTPAGDLSLIYAYMKMLDAESVVRETELRMAQKAGSFWDRANVEYQKVTSGQQLSPAMRADFVQRAEMLYKVAQEQQTQTEGQYRGMAQRRPGIDVERAAPTMMPPGTTSGGGTATMEFNRATGRLEPVKK